MSGQGGLREIPNPISNHHLVSEAQFQSDDADFSTVNNLTYVDD